MSTAAFDTVGEDPAFGSVLALIRLITDPQACEARLRELRSALAALAAAEAKLGKAREAFDQHQREQILAFEKKMDALAIRLAAVADIDQRQAWICDQLAVLNRSGIPPDPNLFGTLTREGPRQ